MLFWVELLGLLLWEGGFVGWLWVMMGTGLVGEVECMSLVSGEVLRGESGSPCVGDPGSGV